MACVSDVDVLGLLQDTLEPDRRAVVERHLDGCAECLELVTLAAQTSIVARATGPAGSAEDPTTEDVGALPPGTRIARYEIVAPLGHGGMGMVYTARDAQLGRQVALKLVHPRLASDPASQLALLREAQAMARITQPNVLTVYDVGAYGDAVFLAAERVDGMTLERWLARPQRWRAIVEVCTQAARGLAAAHAAGLVHRDFKPSNVLVGHDGRVRVFDFGVVRFADSAVAAGERAGTPLYMAPEQLRGEVADARTDQYAWCATLHEALTGELPTAVAARAGHRGRAAHRVPRWLRDVLARGLADAPDARFPSLAALLAALERGRTRRRRASIAAVAGLAVTAAVATALIGYAGGVRAPQARCAEPVLAGWDATRKLALARAFLATGLPYAPTVWLRAVRELDGFAAGWRGQQRDACLAHEVRGVDDAARRRRRGLCLEHQALVAASIVDRLAAPGRELAAQVPTLLAALPDVASCGRAELPDVPADPLTRARLVNYFHDAARVSSLAAAGRVDEAAREIEPVLRAAPTLGLPSAEADATYLAGHVASLAGKYDEAGRLVERAMWAALAIRDDELVAQASSELLDIMATQQRRPAAAGQFVELARASAERVGSTRARARAARAIGVTALAVGHYAAAETELSRALALAQADTPPDQTLVAALLDRLGGLAMRLHDPAKAVPLRERAIALFVAELGPLHPGYAKLLSTYALSLENLGRRREALAIFEQAIAIQEHALGPTHPDLAQMLETTAELYLDNGGFARARALLGRALAICERTLPANHPLRAMVQEELGEALRLDGDYAGAERIARDVLAGRRAELGVAHHATIQSLLDVGWLALWRGDPEAARAVCAEAVAALPNRGEANPAGWAVAMTCLGEVDVAQGRPAQAVPRIEAALPALEAAVANHEPMSAPPLAAARFALATALPATARARAVALARQARSALEPDKLHYHAEVAQIDAWLRAHAP